MTINMTKTSRKRKDPKPKKKTNMTINMTKTNMKRKTKNTITIEIINMIPKEIKTVITTRSLGLKRINWARIRERNN